jgi:tRNA pseudouridine55 synthase
VTDHQIWAYLVENQNESQPIGMMERFQHSGLLLIDKPPGVTSFEVVRRVRKALKVKKVGHLGTLDPFATGLLPLALGEATKLTPFLMEERKTYLATCRLGVETDTQDLTGQVVAKTEEMPEPPAIYRAAAALVGEIEQTPPAYSAVHYQGERLYCLARRGLKVAVPPRRVTVFRLEVTEVNFPLVTFLVECGKGTYVRALAHDLGLALGCGAHLVALSRLAVGPFRLDEALSLEQVEKALSPEEVRARIISLPQCLPRLKGVVVDRLKARRLAQGQALPWTENGLAVGEQVKVLADDNLVAVAEVRLQGAGRVLAPLRVFLAARE